MHYQRLIRPSHGYSARFGFWINGSHTHDPEKTTASIYRMSKVFRARPVAQPVVPNCSFGWMVDVTVDEPTVNEPELVFPKRKHDRLAISTNRRPAPASIVSFRPVEVGKSVAQIPVACHYLTLLAESFDRSDCRRADMTDARYLATSIMERRNRSGTLSPQWFQSVVASRPTTGVPN